jgi:hypothetical protein
MASSVRIWFFYLQKLLVCPFAHLYNARKYVQYPIFALILAPCRAHKSTNPTIPLTAAESAAVSGMGVLGWLRAPNWANIKANHPSVREQKKDQTLRTHAVKREDSCLYKYHSNHIIRPIGLMLEVGPITILHRAYGIDLPTLTSTSSLKLLFERAIPNYMNSLRKRNTWSDFWKKDIQHTRW